MARRKRESVPVDEWVDAARKLEQASAGEAIGGADNGSPTEGPPAEPDAINAQGAGTAPAPAQPEPAAAAGADGPVGGAGRDVINPPPAYPAEAYACPSKCDGDHGAPACPDPGCWQRDGYGGRDTNLADPLDAYDRETVDLIDQAERLAREAEREWEEKHTDASAAKKKFEKAVEDMRQLVRDRRDMRGKPKPVKLYPDPDQGEGAGESDDEFDDADQHCDDSAPYPAVPAAAEDGSWESVPLASLNLAKGVLKRLAEPEHKTGGKLSSITTLGELAKFIGDGFPERVGWYEGLFELKGIGEGKAESVRDAVAAFFAEQAAPAGAG
jgi:hypothetical protein